ncbi:MAG: patatin [Gemmatimonadetes bacterium]|nr:patatin-like phospholipase family protein [Gemmatimonadota bacterium]MXX35186.1 patatin [Gemmatimonadota bacterium]MYD15433.1 patatin [Gemmatimonadota bacterium]MYI66171.1 patatin [Gemmatimonadota bacterium]
MSGNSSNGRHGDLAFVMGGGGARAAYQAGVLRYLSRRFPRLQIPIITGVSAGAINAAHLAAHHGTFEQATEELFHMWSNLNVDHVFRTDVGSLSWHVLRWARQLVSGGSRAAPRVRGLLDTDPLRAYLTDAMHAIDGELTGINYNLRMGRLKAVALSTTNYSTGQSVLWVQGQGVKEWERPTRRSRLATLTVEHVLASSALPIVFPAVQIGPHWFGDGGIRLAAPLSPALHLGAGRILAISTRHSPTARQANRPTVTGYPPPAQVAGVMMNSVFLDLLDDDAHRLETINRLLAGLPPEERGGMRPVRLLTVRPSVDLARLANRYEPQLPKAFRFLTRGLGTRQIEAPDFLSMIMFQPDYLAELIRVGEEDAETREGELAALLEPDGKTEISGGRAGSATTMATDGRKAT